MAPEPLHTFDAVRSLILDTVIFELEAGAAGLWRRWLLLRKRILERNVPGLFAEVR